MQLHKPFRSAQKRTRPSPAATQLSLLSPSRHQHTAYFTDLEPLTGSPLEISTSKTKTQSTDVGPSLLYSPCPLFI